MAKIVVTCPHGCGNQQVEPNATLCPQCGGALVRSQERPVEGVALLRYGGGGGSSPPRGSHTFAESRRR